MIFSMSEKNQKIHSKNKTKQETLKMSLSLSISFFLFVHKGFPVWLIKKTKNENINLSSPLP